MIPLLNRHRQIIGFLLNKRGWIKALEISRYINVSDRTIRDDIKLINELVLEYHISIESCRGKGYRIREKDMELFSKLLRLEQEKVPVLPEERMKYIIERLLTGQDGIDPFQIADELFVSEQTVEVDIKKIKNMLQRKYKYLEIYKEDNRYFLKGKEKYKRYLLCNVVMDGTFESLLDLHNYSPYLRGMDLIKVKDILMKSIKDSNFAFSDMDLVSLIIHCAVSVQRMKQGFYLEEGALLNMGIPPREMEIARIIAVRISKEYGVVFNDSELINIANNISLKKASFHHQRLELEKGSNKGSIKLVEQLLENVKDEYNLDFTKDKHLKIYLSSHFDSLMKRISHNRVYNNPYLDEIKNNYPYLFEIAVFIRKKFYELTNMSMKEDEIGYIAIHLGAALERKKVKDPIKRVALVSQANNAYKQLLYNKLLNLFSHKVEIIGPFAVYEIDKLKQQNPHMIISTVRLSENIGIPSVVTSIFLDDQDIIQIKKLIDNLDSKQEKRKLMEKVKDYIDKDLFYSGLDFKTCDDVIDFMAEKIIEKGFAPESFKESVFKREKISPTSFDNLIAMPHSIEANGYKTGISVLILKEPIKWAEKNVQIIFMFSLKKGEQGQLKNIYRLIQELVLGGGELVRELSKATSFDKFVEQLVNLVKKERA